MALSISDLTRHIGSPGMRVSLLGEFSGIGHQVFLRDLSGVSHPAVIIPGTVAAASLMIELPSVPFGVYGLVVTSSDGESDAVQFTMVSQLQTPSMVQQPGQYTRAVVLQAFPSNNKFPLPFTEKTPSTSQNESEEGSGWSWGGYWNAQTNEPSLTLANTTPWTYYVVAVGGNTQLGSYADFRVGDVVLRDNNGFRVFRGANSLDFRCTGSSTTGSDVLDFVPVSVESVIWDLTIKTVTGIFSCQVKAVLFNGEGIWTTFGVLNPTDMEVELNVEVVGAYLTLQVSSIADGTFGYTVQRHVII